MKLNGILRKDTSDSSRLVQLRLKLLRKPGQFNFVVFSSNIILLFSLYLLQSKTCGVSCVQRVSEINKKKTVEMKCFGPIFVISVFVLIVSHEKNSVSSSGGGIVGYVLQKVGLGKQLFRQKQMKAIQNNPTKHISSDKQSEMEKLQNDLRESALEIERAKNLIIMGVYRKEFDAWLVQHKSEMISTFEKCINFCLGGPLIP